MSFQTFLNDPKSYLATHEMYVHPSAAGQQALNAALAVANVNNFQSKRYAIIAGHHLTMQQTGGMNQTQAGFFGNVGRKLHVSKKIRRDYSVAAHNAEIGFRYLPDQPGYVTYIGLDQAATFALTGPLTGCTVAAGRDNNGMVWFFHSFRPDGTAPGLAPIIQSLAINHLLAGLNINQNTMRYCRYGTEYNGMGFAFGRLRGNVWKFYSHATNFNPQITETHKWGEI